MSTTHNHAAGMGTYTQSGMTNYPGYQTPDIHLGKFPDHTDVQSWRVSFRMKVCSKAKNHRLALQWIKEIETAKSNDDLITPKSITGRDFPDYDELVLKIAAALKNCFDRHTHFRKKASVEEQRSQNNDRFLRGRQIAFVIYDHFRSTGFF